MDRRNGQVRRKSEIKESKLAIFFGKWWIGPKLTLEKANLLPKEKTYCATEKEEGQV